MSMALATRTNHHLDRKGVAFDVLCAPLDPALRTARHARTCRVHLQKRRPRVETPLRRTSHRQAGITSIKLVLRMPDSLERWRAHRSRGHVTGTCAASAWLETRSRGSDGLIGPSGASPSYRGGIAHPPLRPRRSAKPRLEGDE